MEKKGSDVLCFLMTARMNENQEPSFQALFVLQYGIIFLEDGPGTLDLPSNEIFILKRKVCINENKDC